MKKELPQLVITGFVQDFIEIEMILIMLGYDMPNETENNEMTNSELYNFDADNDFVLLVGYNSENNNIRYFQPTEPIPDYLISFKATEIEGIINFVLKLSK